MASFPQLNSGALSQFPIVKRRSYRTVVNECPDGTVLKYADAGANTTEWKLAYDQITRDEMDAIRSFFESMEGRRGTFTFVDPTGNLLAWSEQLDEPAWQKDPLLKLTSGIADPGGGKRAWRIENGTGAAQRIIQTVAAPSGLYYCFSLYARSQAPVTVRLVRDDDTVERAAGERWGRAVMPTHVPGEGESLTFGLELPPGATVEVFGMQVEAQAGASTYKKTAGQSGVYTGARFAEDTLRMTATAFDRYSCTLRIFHGKHL